MDPPVTRSLLAAQRGLSREAVDAALALSGLRPTMAERREFAVRAMKFAGVLSFAAGIIFLIAFNWEQIGVYGRFAMVELPMLVALAVVWVKGADQFTGKLAMMLAVLLTGALLALAGQTYQTGADLYELFFAWAALTLPWAIVCRYAPCWALWVLVLNIGVTLYPASGTPLTFLFFLNLVVYIIVEAAAFRATGWGLGERWLRRGLMAAAMAFGTAVMMFQILDSKYSSGALAGLTVFLFLAASVGIGLYAYLRKDDLFHFAVLALAWVVVTTTLVGRAMADSNAGLGSLFLIAVYVIGASAAAVMGITRIARQWKESAQ